VPISQYIDPAKIRSKGTLEFKPIELNSFDVPFKTSAKQLGKSTMTAIYSDMYTIREFETMLYSVRTTKQYRDIPYVYTGPAHLYTGQEAAAVGMAFALERDDVIFGGHRSHGEVLAKGLCAIRRLPEDELYSIMRNAFDGAILAPVEAANTGGDVRDLAFDFLLYGFMSELFGRETGFAKGLGNSMHVFFTPFGIYPNNAIVGGSAGISAGAALFKRVNQKPGIVVCNIGDASLGCGPVWEALNFSAMDQLTKLWDEAHRGGLPVIFNFLNNSYGMGGQTSGETMAYDTLARVGAGISPTQLHAERVDGYNPLAVLDAFRRKRELIERREGPVLLDTITYRIAGHSATDASTYRSKEEIAAWQEADSIQAFAANLIGANVAGNSDLAAIRESVEARIARIMRLAIDLNVSPRINLSSNPDAIRSLMLSNERVPSMSAATPETLTPPEENSRIKKIAEKSRFHLDSNGKEVSKLKQYTYRDALFEAIVRKFYTDPTLIAFGEDNRDWGGAFGVYGGLTESLPYHRFFNAPISEGTIVAASVGYAMMGGRAIPELMYCDFLGRAGDEVFNQLSKWQSMSAGVLKMPVVLRVSVGAKYGAQHAQDWTALTAHIPGLKVCFPATPYDAKGLMTAALNGTDPVVFFESQKLYDIGEQFHAVPEEDYEIPIGLPDVKRAGSELTILTIGASLYAGLKAADMLAERGISAEVVDARSLVPFDYDVLLTSVRKTGRLVVVSDACERGSVAGEIARNVTEFAFDSLDAPPIVVAAPNAISPCPELEEWYFPQASWILDAVHQKILPLEGYAPTLAFGTVEKIRRAKLGV
jgi:2-oxoisovalerate dehydrogenase E1 component